MKYFMLNFSLNRILSVLINIAISNKIILSYYHLTVLYIILLDVMDKLLTNALHAGVQHKLIELKDIYFMEVIIVNVLKIILKTLTKIASNVQKFIT